MKLVSVNVSLPKKVSYHGKTITTAIFKEPVPGRVQVRRLNVDGDDQADRRVHGVGFEMAVYWYPVEHYPFWQQELGREGFPHGQFGENFTVEGLSEETVRVGDIFRVGEALLQVTQPRIPCYKLTLRMDETSDFPRRFQESGRVGFYCRVLEEGEVGAADTIALVESHARSVTIAEFVRVYLNESHEPESLRRVLASRDLGEAWRVYLEKMLKKAEPVVTPRGWRGFREFRVDRKVRESETISSFYLKPQDEKPLPSFLPGQFLTFRLNVPGHPNPVMRTYSLSDSPNHPEYYRVSIKRLPAPVDRPEWPPGLSSNFFHSSVESGARLCVKAPGGRFCLDPDDDTPVVLLSGGVGLTPTISMLNAITESGSDRPVWFIHGTRSGREHAMGAHVRRLATELPHVNAFVAYSQPSTDDVEGHDYDAKGRVDLALLKRILPPAVYDFYLCGPAGFMKSLYEGLLEWGVAESRVHYEFFGPASVLKKRPGKNSGPSDTDVEVTFAKSDVTTQWDPSAETLLELAEARGLRPPFSCRTGVCHTCMCKLVEGEVEYVQEPLDVPDPGCVLICSAKPKTNVIIDV